MSIVENIRLHYPLPVAKLYEAMMLESEPRQRVRKLVDLFERTSQYLVLVGLACYQQQNLSDSQVETLRPDLTRPSLGHWVGLLKALSRCLRPNDPNFLTADPRQNYKDEPIGTAVETVRQALGLNSLKNVLLHHFLDTMVEFRNKKIGHGDLSLAEAEQVQQPLEAAITQWLGELLTLYERHLLYVTDVKWQNQCFVYVGTKLNTGTSLEAFQLEGDQGLDDKTVYLHFPANNNLVPLWPYFIYHPHTQVLYTYSELSNQDEPLLRCSYHAPGAAPLLTISADKALIVGGETASTPSPQSADNEEPATASVVDTVVETIAETRESTYMRNWFDIITPHADIRKGQFDEAVFAADVGDVADGNAPTDYSDPYLFFKKTYLTDGLTNLLTRVHDKLTTGQGNAVVQIQTPFGGGKTHSLVTIYHYLKHGQKVKDLLPEGIGLLTPRISVIAGNHWDPLAGKSSDGLTRRTFWGEIGYQIGGQAGYDVFRDNDEKRISPGKEKLRDFLAAHQPFVLLFDEVLEYINRAMDVRDKLDVALGTQTFSFFQELTEAVATLPKGMLVVTLPSSQLEDFGEREEEALARLSKIFGRLESIETPVRGEEIYAVIRRRLFEVETLRGKEMKETVHRYFILYQQNRDDLPPKARDVNYKDKMEMAYPFHPDLIDILSEKWSTFSSFQRTRGVLRLLANVIEDLYQQETNIDMILPGDINLEKPGIRQEFIKHIGSEYEGVIASDIAGHEAKSQALDKANRSWKHLAQRISNAIFCHSFSADDSEKGISLPYIKLAVLRSDTIPAMATEVLQKLGNELWYLNSRGDAYYFSRIPNLNRMILDKKELFNQTYETELKSIIQKEVGSKFTAYLWPDSSDAIADNRSLKLIILHPTDNGSRIPSWIERKGNAFREYQNTLFFVLADTAAFAKMREDVKTFLALQEIESIIKSGDMPQLETKKDEIQRRLRDVRRDFSYNVRRMYHTLQFGQQKLDLGQPTAGNENMSTWYWRELTDGNVGAIVERLGYRIIVNKLLADNDQVAAGVILDQFYKNPDLPVPAQPEVVARAIQLGVQDKALGLTEMTNDELDPHKLKYGDAILLDSIAFEPGIYIVSQSKADELLAKIPPPPTLPGLTDDSGIAVGPPDSGDIQPPTPPTPTPPLAADRYKRVRLVINNIPAGKIADVNRGVLLPLSSLVKDMKFTLEIDVSSEEGVPKATLENKIKETIRQIGAQLGDETLE
ncbi:MAG: ATP-binding protein [Anaerolineae bacterium]|nr:ATP-binding protein [Anaerolineae bacterium]